MPVPAGSCPAPGLRPGLVSVSSTSALSDGGDYPAVGDGRIVEQESWRRSQGDRIAGGAGETTGATGLTARLFAVGFRDPDVVEIVGGRPDAPFAEPEPERRTRRIYVGQAGPGHGLTA